MPIKRLYWDIETSPNIMFSWRAGRKIYLPPENIIREGGIICVCYKWEGRDEIGCLEWNMGDDSELCENLSIILGSADELVAHNGDNFDIKWFNARYLFHRLPPIPKYKTVDTLKIARRHFRLNSNKLTYLASLLFQDEKIHTEFSMWENITLHNSDLDMQRMVKYCRKDVALLERVYKRLSDFEDSLTHAGVVDGKGRWTCNRCGSENVKKSKTLISKKGIESHQMQCKECGKYYSVTGLVFRQYLTAKYGETLAA